MRKKQTKLEQVAIICSKCDKSNNAILNCKEKSCIYYTFLFANNPAISEAERISARANALNPPIQTEQEKKEIEYLKNKIKAIMDTPAPTRNGWTVEEIAKKANLPIEETKDYMDLIFNVNR